MLRRLFIKNIVLIESCEVHFQPGFNVLTGETGAGKSLLLSAIGLLLGQRQDTGLIRQGETTALVEASFDIAGAREVITFLEEAGVEVDAHEELIIKRELHASGKGRTFINNSSAQLHFLKKLAPYLMEISAQHTHMQLICEEQPLLLLDQFGKLDEKRAEVQKLYSQSSQIKKKLQAHIDSQAVRRRQIQTCEREIEEIEKANLKESEDEELFTRYVAFSENAAISSHIAEVSEQLEALLQLARQKAPFERLVDAKNELKPLYESYSNSIEELKEVAFEISKIASRLDVPAHEMAKIEARLQEIDGLKKKYGESTTKILEWKSTQEKELKKLLSDDDSLEELQEALQKSEQELDSAARALTAARKKTAQKLADCMTEELRELNMPHAEFEIRLTTQPRSHFGDEAVHFFLTANPGEAAVDIQKGASGGELARVALALHSLNSAERQVCIVFDEVDANIGGETASIVGKKLSGIANGRQVIAVTHFPQVAICADAHFRISKKLEQDRTQTHIEFLEHPTEKQEELSRMLGGQTTNLFTNYQLVGSVQKT